MFASLAETVRYIPKQVVYHAGDAVNAQGLFFIVEGSCTVSKCVELKELTKMQLEQSGHGIRLGHGITPTNAALQPPGPAGSTTLSVSSIPARWTNLNEKQSDSAYEVKLRTLESRQWFGYCTMLNMAVRQSTVTSAEHSIALVWSDHALNEFFSRFPGTSALLRDCIGGQKLMRELCNTSFLTNLQEEHAALLTTLFQSRYVPANTVIFEGQRRNEADTPVGWIRSRALSHPLCVFCSEGDPASESSSLFMLVSGSAVMYQAVPGGGQNLVKAIEPGAFFGEACMLFRLPRIGTVRTNHASLLMELSLASFTSFLRYTPYLGVDVKKAFNNNSIASVYLMQNPVILQAFTEFCAAEHSGENVEFFAAAKQFRTSPLRQKALITLDARSIFDKFVSASASSQVNLFSTTRDRIASAIEHNIINKLTFEEAEEEILHLMDRDSFNRFKQSGMFQEALQRCRDKQ